MAPIDIMLILTKYHADIVQLWTFSPLMYSVVLLAKNKTISIVINVIKQIIKIYYDISV